MAYTRPLYLTNPTMKGNDVKEVQTRLSQIGFYTGSIDSSFGNATKQAVLKFQADTGLSQDGSCGPATWDRLFYINLKNPIKRGTDVKKVQQALTEYGYNPGGIDGFFGNGSKNAITKFQRANNLTQDGSCGPATWNKLFNSNKLSIVKDITEKLKGLMLRYEYMFSPELNGYDMSAAKLLKFYNIVDNNAIIDLKRRGWKDYNYLFNGTVYRNDGPGNILYGYMGKVFKINENFLLTAAGIVNAKDYIKEHSKLPPKEWITKYYGDDPYDAMCIKVGISYFNTHHK